MHTAKDAAKRVTTDILLLLWLKQSVFKKIKNFNFNLICDQTSISLGCFFDFLYKSSEASLDLLTKKSNEGPISVSSTSGTLPTPFKSVVLYIQKNF